MTGDDSLEAADAGPVQAIVPFEEVPTKWVNFIVKTDEHFGFPPPPST